MSDRMRTVARGIDEFVRNPVTNLLKGAALLVIGVCDASRTFHEDVARGHVHIGHGLIIIGLFSMLGALPQLIDALQTGGQILKDRETRRAGRVGSRDD